MKLLIALQGSSPVWVQEARREVATLMPSPLLMLALTLLVPLIVFTTA